MDSISMASTLAVTTTLGTAARSDSDQPRRPSRRERNSQTPLTPLQRQLAEQFLPLARSLARPLKQMFRHWKDDFDSAACLALVEAARSFDPSRNIRFATFARFRIRGALHDVGRSMRLTGWDRAQGDPPQVQRLTQFNEDQGVVLNATRDRGVGADVDAADSLEQWLRKVPKRHAEVCRLCYVEGKTQAEVAALIGVSQSEVTRLHRQALELLADPYTSPNPHRKPARTQPGRSRSRSRQESAVSA